MRTWTAGLRGCTWLVLTCMLGQLLILPAEARAQNRVPAPKVTILIPGEAPNTSSVAASEETTSSVQEAFDRMKTLLNGLVLTVASSPLLMRALAHQLGRIKNTRMRQWVRESYFVADQVLAEASRSGLVDPAKLDKSRIMHQEMGKMLSQAGWIERLAMGKELQDGRAFQEADALGAKLARKTFYGEVAELRADQRIPVELGDELLRIQSEGVLTPRQLAAELLRKTDLSPREIRELARTYETKQTIRVQGRRESLFDATILNKVEPWRDGGTRQARSSYIDRQLGADLLLFEGSPEDFTRHLAAHGHLVGDDASRIVDEFVAELKKETAFRQELQRKKAVPSIDGADGPAPKAATTGSAADGTAPRNATAGSAPDGTAPRNATAGSAADGIAPRNPTAGSTADGTPPRNPTAGTTVDGTPPRNPTAGTTVDSAGADEFKAARRYRGSGTPLEAGTSESVLRKILSKIKTSSGVHGRFVERFSTPVDVVETRDVFIRNADGRIQVSSTLLNKVVATSGEKGMAFLLGHELAHQTLTKSGATLAPVSLELEADRLGYDWARKAYPELDGRTVKTVLDSFPVGDGLLANRVGELKASMSPQAPHPIDGERLYRLAEANGFAADRGFDLPMQRGAFQADSSMSGRLKGLSGGLRGTAAVGRAVDSFRYDFLRGGLLVDVGVSAAMRLVSRWQAGDGVGESFRAVGDELMSAEFLIGDLLGGTLGAALGSMITIPGTAALGGFLGASLGMYPAVLCTMVFAQAGYAAVRLLKEGDFSLKNLWAEIPVGTLLGQSIGAVLGMAAGAILLPGPVGALLGGLVGGTLAVKLLGAVTGAADRAAGRGDDEGLPSAPGTESADPLLQGIEAADPLLQGIDLAHPDETDLAALNRALQTAYEDYLRAGRARDAQAPALFRRYLAVQKSLEAVRRTVHSARGR